MRAGLVHTCDDERSGKEIYSLLCFCDTGMTVLLCKIRCAYACSLGTINEMLTQKWISGTDRLNTANCFGTTGCCQEAHKKTNHLSQMSCKWKIKPPVYFTISGLISLTKSARAVVCVCARAGRKHIYVRVNKSRINRTTPPPPKKTIEAEIKCAKWLQNKMKPQWDEAK